MLLLANLVSVPVEVSGLQKMPIDPHKLSSICNGAQHVIQHVTQVACILPFMRFGEFIIGAPKLDAAPLAIKDIIFSHPGAALKGIAHALIGWIILPPFIVVTLAQVLKPIFDWAGHRYEAQISVSVCLGRHRQSNCFCKCLVDPVQACTAVNS